MILTDVGFLIDWYVLKKLDVFKEYGSQTSEMGNS